MTTILGNMLNVVFSTALLGWVLYHFITHEKYTILQRVTLTLWLFFCIITIPFMLDGTIVPLAWSFPANIGAIMVILGVLPLPIVINVDKPHYLRWGLRICAVSALIGIAIIAFSYFSAIL